MKKHITKLLLSAIILLRCCTPSIAQVKFVPLAGTNNVGGVISYSLNTHRQYGTYSLIDKAWADSMYAKSLSGTGFVYQSGSTTSYTNSIPNSSLSNSTFTVNGVGMALGTSSNVISAGTGISIGSNSVITNTAPNQTVTLTGAGSTTVTGTYPTYTINSSGGGGGTATPTQIAYFAGTSKITGSTSAGYLDTTTIPFKWRFGIGTPYTGGGINSNPIWNFTDSANHSSFLQIQNRFNGNNAQIGLNIVGASTVSTNDNFFLTVTSPTYSVYPNNQNMAQINAASGLNGLFMYTSGNPFGFCSKDSVSNGKNYFPYAIVNNGSNGYIGINNPSTIVDPLTVRGAITSTALSNTTTIYHQPIVDYTGHIYNDDNARFNITSHVPILINQACPTGGAYYASGFDATGSLLARTNVVFNVADGGLTPIASFTTSSGGGSIEVSSSASTASSSVFTGSYNNALYGCLRTHNSSYSTSYPFVASATLLFGRGGELDLGTYDNYQITFFTNATERANFNTSGKLYLGGSTSATSQLHISAGSTTANTAPLQFTQGARETSARAGVMEYDSLLYFTNNTTVGRYAVDIDSKQYTTPVTTNTVVCNQYVKSLVCNPAGTLAALTITFPPHPRDGMVFRISISQIITSLTLNTSDGSTIKGTIITSAVNGKGGFVYDVTANAWFQQI